MCYIYIQQKDVNCKYFLFVTEMKHLHVFTGKASDILLFKPAGCLSHTGLSLILETESDNMVQNQQFKGFVIHNTGEITCW